MKKDQPSLQLSGNSNAKQLRHAKSRKKWQEHKKLAKEEAAKKKAEEAKGGSNKQYLV